jgi:hypothetical protein
MTCGSAGLDACGASESMAGGSAFAAGNSSSIARSAANAAETSVSETSVRLATGEKRMGCLLPSKKSIADRALENNIAGR